MVNRSGLSRYTTNGQMHSNPGPIEHGLEDTQQTNQVPGNSNFLWLSVSLLVSRRAFVPRRYSSTPKVCQKGVLVDASSPRIRGRKTNLFRHVFPCLVGLRVDGRRPAELRKITSTTAVLSQADGSAYLEHGNTKVLAAVYGPREARHRGLVLHDRAIINVEFNVAPFSTGERRRRTKNDKYDL